MPNFTEKMLDGLKPESKLYRAADSACPGLKIAVYPSGIKTFKVIKRPKGQKPVTVTLGKYPEMTIFIARKKAIEAMDSISSGDNPNDSGKANVTFRQAFDEYCGIRELKETTLNDYNRTMTQHLTG